MLDLTRVLAGPTCARSLAEHGADVLKITAAHLADLGAVELDTGIGKLSARLDLREEAGVRTLRALAAEADVFSQSYRPGALAARGFSPEALAKLRPGIVCASLSAWGGSGPLARAARLRQHRSVGQRHGAGAGRRETSRACCRCRRSTT